MVAVQLERLKSPKIATFDYTDDFTREWFKSTFHMAKSVKLNRLNVSSENISTFLRKVSEFLKNSPAGCSTADFVSLLEIQQSHGR